MKYLFSLLHTLALWCLLVVSPTPAVAQASSWQMATAIEQGNSSSGSSVFATAIDATGNVYLTGTFSGTVRFGATSLTSAGFTDVFVAKWSPVSGGFVWAQRAGGTGNESPQGIALQGTSVYVCGSFSSLQADFGSTTLVKAGLPPMGMGNITADAFICKLTDTGSNAGFAWSLRAGGAADDKASGVAVAGGSVYLTGTYSSPTFDWGSTRLTNATGTNKVFVAKFADAGTNAAFDWAIQNAATNSDNVSAIAVQGSAIYLHGTFGGASTTFGSTTLTSLGGTDVYVAKLTDLGSAATWTWALSAGTGDFEYSGGLAVYGPNVYIVGTFANPNTMRFGAASLTNTANMNLYVAKLTDAGSQASWTWTQSTSAGGGSVWGVQVAASADGVYVTGYFGASLSSPRFGSTTLANPACPSCLNLFLARLTDAGNFTWARQANSNGTTPAYSLSLRNRQLYVAGHFGGLTAGFDSHVITNANGGTSGRSTGFIASLTDNTPTAVRAPAWAAGLALLPNPARQRATVVATGLAGTSQASLTLCDALGRVVRKSGMFAISSQFRHEYDLAGLSPGLYFMRVQIGPEHAQLPLVME